MRRKSDPPAQLDIDGNTNIFDVANKFLNDKRRRFPILEDGKLIGQISQKDILKATVKMRSQRWWK
ncbi:CBS domain-containing protein [Pricia antarctica]|uniref:CBS domain-containing protein n=1 Tax=Pricia antarctica TaxID=641691 RepID=A0A1G7E865_9FLAO|nr:CBS domain-containing protein [Pricia antarctica]